MRILVTGGTGVLGRATLPLLAKAGYRVTAPGRRELDLFDPRAVTPALRAADAVMHLATRIPPADERGDPAAWAENDRLRRDASRILVDGAVQTDVAVYVQPTVAFLYPLGGPTDEAPPIDEVPPTLRSALDAEREALRFAACGRRGVVLRLGLLFGPTTGTDEPPREAPGLHVADAATALVAALDAPSGIYNVVTDATRVPNDRFKSATGWRPRH